MKVQMMRDKDFGCPRISETQQIVKTSYSKNRDITTARKLQVHENLSYLKALQKSRFALHAANIIISLQ